MPRLSRLPPLRSQPYAWAQARHQARSQEMRASAQQLCASRTLHACSKPAARRGAQAAAASRTARKVEVRDVLCGEEREHAIEGLAFEAGDREEVNQPRPAGVSTTGWVGCRHVVLCERPVPSLTHTLPILFQRANLKLG